MSAIRSVVDDDRQTGATAALRSVNGPSSNSVAGSAAPPSLQSGATQRGGATTYTDGSDAQSAQIRADNSGLQTLRNNGTLQDFSPRRTGISDAPRMRPNLDPRLNAMRQEQTQLSAMLASGRGPNGRPLTADGYAALAGRANALDRGMNDLIGIAGDTYRSQLSNQNSLDVQGMRNAGALDQQALSDQGALERQRLVNAGQLENTGLSNTGAFQRQQLSIAGQLANTALTGVGDYNRFRTEAGRFEMKNQALPASILPDPIERPQEYEAAVATENLANQYIGQAGGDPAAARINIQNEIESLRPADNRPMPPDQARAVEKRVRELQGVLNNIDQRRGMVATIPRQNFAEGGIVQAPRPMELGAPSGMNITSIQNYQKYVNMAREMGVDPISFEEFSSMVAPQQHGQLPGMPEMQPNAQASQQVLGMAAGGMVPEMGAEPMGALASTQVDGKMVVDPNPSAPTDSIPAMVDGQQPAALDSGEFVLPKDVVMFYGTQYLNKLMEKARSGGQSATAGVADG